jgi:hypothetical protein
MKCVNVNTWTFQWEHCGKIYDGKSRENHGKIYGKIWEILYKWNVIIGKIIENQTGNFQQTMVEYHVQHIEVNLCFRNLHT